MKKIWNKIYVHIIAIILFLLISLLYLSPILDGKMIQQFDVTKARGMQKELKDYYDETGETALWTNSMFSGMPAYQIVVLGASKNNIYEHIGKFLRMNLPRNSMDILFIYMIGFYILLIVMGVNPWLSMIGAFAFAFSSYNIIIIGAGHVNKAFVIGLMPLVLGGVILTYRRKYIVGFILTVLGLGINIYFNHLQMTYYLLIMILIYAIIQLINDFRKKQIAKFIQASMVLLAAAVLAVLPNITNLITTYEYSRETTRGGTELTTEDKTQETGLDTDYALEWSYGKLETFTLLIPDFMGGASSGSLSKDSKTYQALVNNNVPRNQAEQFINQVPTYWGDQLFTAGPTYFGAVIIFLFIAGIFLVRSRIKWWLFASAIVSIILAWGSNFMELSEFFLDHVPFYNKFRAVSSILVVASIAFPFLGFLMIKELLNPDIKKQEKQKSINYSLYITGGIALFFALLGGLLFDFESTSDAQMISSGYPEWLINAIQADRASLLTMDSLRSLVFIVLTFALCWTLISNKIKFTYFALLLALFIFIDLWSVDKRYLNDMDFIESRKAVELQPTQADIQILQDKDPHFRVFNITQSPFQETYTSYFHKSIGGYHGAKLRRYQDLIEWHLSRQNIDVMNMLNTKYFIVPGANNQPVVQRNPDALGNAWYVDSVRIVEDANQEIEALNNFNPASVAIVDIRFADMVTGIDFSNAESTNRYIELTEYKPDYLSYKSNSESEGLAVFSEIYYNNKKGWQAYINGEAVPHFRVNYVLRALRVPPGEHTITFKFEPKTFYAGQRISLISSIIASLIIVGLIVWVLIKKSKSTIPD